MVAASHWLSVKLWNHRFAGWERIVAPLFSTQLVSDGVFSPFRTSPVAISNWVPLLRIPGANSLINSGKNTETSSYLCNCLHHCAPSMCVSEVLMTRSHVRAFTIAFLRLQYPDSSPFSMLMVRLLCHGEKLSFSSKWLGRVNCMSKYSIEHNLARLACTWDTVYLSTMLHLCVVFV